MSPDLAQRCLDPERMDDAAVSVEEMESALRDVDRVNRYLGGWSGSARLLSRVAGSARRLSLLDVGAGSGGTARFLSRWARRRGLSLSITLADLHPAVCRIAQANTSAGGGGDGEAGAGIRVVRSDARQLPFRDRSFDVAHASLVLHHFGREDIARILAEMLRVSRRAVLINDLERRPFALHAIHALVSAFSHSPIVKHDAPLSVRRGFLRREMEAWRKCSGFETLEIRRSFPYRLLAWQMLEDAADHGAPGGNGSQP
jgi:ubiquinone/menaquinone biosynthesis C-methylase UbiE